MFADSLLASEEVATNACCACNLNSSLISS